MKKILLLVLALTVSVGMLRAQDLPYYGTPFLKQGFDSTTIAKTNWVQAGDSAGVVNNTLWKPANPTSTAQQFSKADASSKFSASVQFGTSTPAMNTALTSPEIDMAGKSNICLGFSLHNTRASIEIVCLVTKDDGSTWDSVWFSSKSSIYETRTSLITGLTSWTSFNIFLPSHYNGQKIKIKFVAQSAIATGILYLDGVFLSERRNYDAQLLSVIIKEKEISAAVTTKTTFVDGFLRESVTLKIKNNGAVPFSTIKLLYQLGANTAVEETATFLSPLPSGDSTLYTFKSYADFSALGATTIKAFMNLTNEENRYNDSTKGIIELSNVTKELPYYADWTKTSTDNWPKEAGVGSAVWTAGLVGSNYDYTLKNTNQTTANAYLFSAPFLLKAGKNYDLRFSLYTNSTVATDMNAVDIYFTDNKTTATFNTLSRIFSKADITNDSKYKDYFIRLVPTKDSIYYITFHAKSEALSSLLALENVQLTEAGTVNAQIVNLVAPLTPNYEYGNAEQVKIRIRNSGTSTIGANTIKAYYQLDDNALVQQTVVASINPGSTVDFTFTQTIDIATLSNKTLKTWVELPSDVATYNDTLNSVLVPLVTTLPFEGILPKTAGYYNDYWTDDGKWEVSLNGGYWQLSGSTTTPIQPEEDFLYTRPIRLAAGEVMNMTYQVKAGLGTAGAVFTSAIYKKEGAAFVEVQKIRQDSLKTSTATTFRSSFTASSANDYYIGFYSAGLLKTGLQISSKTSDDALKATPAFDNDLQVSEILFPGSSVVGLDSLPVGVRIRNVGKQAVDGFSVGYKANKGVSVTDTVLGVLASNQEKIFYFATQPSFKGTGTDSLTTWVRLFSDQALYNDTVLTTIQNIAADTIPYSISTIDKFNQFLRIDGNQDGTRWMQISGGGGFSGSGVGYAYVANDAQPDDYLLTKQLKMKAGKTYQLKFNAAVDSAKYPADLQILTGKSNHVENLNEITYLKGINTTTGADHIVYFTPNADTNYTVAFHAAGITKEVKISKVEIQEVEAKPNVSIVIEYPIIDKEYSATDSVVVRVKNLGTTPVAAIPVTCKVNEITQNAVAYSRMGLIPSGDSITFAFNDINMDQLGGYAITAYISVNEDTDRSNDTARVTVQSLPVRNVAVTEIVNPVSGTPEGAADVTVKVKNEGKGDITNIPINYSVNGGALVNDTIKSIIAKDQEIEYTFGTKADVSEEKLYSFLVYTSLDGDVDKLKDTNRKEIRKSNTGFDLSVSGIVTPITGRLTQTEKVTIKVKNNSTFSVPDVPVLCKLNDSVLTGHIPSIAAEAEVEYTFAGTFDMSAFGNYTLIAFTNYVGETNRSNDTLTKIVHCNKLDVGVVALKSPVSKYNMAEETITIVVKNLGEEPVDSIPVRYSYNGRNPITGRVTSEIAPGDSIEYSFPETEDLSQEGTYNFTIYTLLANDDIRSNDTLHVVVTNMGVGIDNISLKDVVLKLYPNPTTNVLNIYSDVVIKHLSIRNVNGQIVEKSDNVGKTNYLVHVEHYRKGVYIVEIQTEKGIVTRKFIVQ